jgi:hypothetical protein
VTGRLMTVAPFDAHNVNGACVVGWHRVYSSRAERAWAMQAVELMLCRPGASRELQRNVFRGLERGACRVHALARSEFLCASSYLLIHTEPVIAFIQRSPDAVAKPRFCTIKFGHDPRYCPVRALEEWIRVAEIKNSGGPVFRPIDRHGHIGSSALSTRNIRAIVKRRCGLAKIDERMVSMRSLRKGAIQQRAYNGAVVGELLDDAGLSHDSATAIANLAAPAREIREHGGPAPDRLEIETFSF